MSGHSKWSTIKRKKAAIDAKRGKIFTRLIREVSVAARIGGASIEGNPRLNRAVAAARAASVPGDNIDKAIKRASGDMEGVVYEEITYEAYGPAGVGILIKVMTDNKTRTVAEVRHALSRNNGSLASANAVSYQFQDLGIITFPLNKIDEDSLLALVLDAGAVDVKNDGENWEVLSEPGSLEAVLAVLKQQGIEASGEIRSVPSSTIPVSGEDATQLLKLLDLLDDLDDVQSVSANFDIDESELERMA